MRAVLKLFVVGTNLIYPPICYPRSGLRAKQWQAEVFPTLVYPYKEIPKQSGLRS
jgi:hypothetical protein